jgi:hypothetical protein
MADISAPMAASLFRTLLTLAVAVSIGLLPIAGGTVFAGKSAAMSSPQSMDDCCHASPCEKTPVDDCASMAACTLKCFNYAPTGLIVPTYLPTLTVDVPLLESVVSYSQIGSPPFRPPRL